VRAPYKQLYIETELNASLEHSLCQYEQKGRYTQKQSEI